MARPATLYQDWMPEELEKLRHSMTITQVCSKWGMNRDSYYRFIKEHPEFEEAHKMGQVHFQAFVEGRLLQISQDGEVAPGQFKGIAMILNNHAKEEYGQGERAGGTQINIQNNITNINNQTAGELEELLKKKLTYLKNNNVIDADFLLLEKSVEEDSDEHS